MTNKVKPQDKPHYVNNKEFSLAVVDYCNRLQKTQKQKSKKIPVIDDYIAECFLKIAEGLSHKSILFDILIVKKWLWTQ